MTYKVDTGRYNLQTSDEKITDMMVQVATHEDALNIYIIQYRDPMTEFRTGWYLTETGFVQMPEGSQIEPLLKIPRQEILYGPVTEKCEEVAKLIANKFEELGLV